MKYQILCEQINFFILFLFSFLILGSDFYQSVKFVDGNLTFTWKSQSKDVSYFVEITKNTTREDWKRINVTQFTLTDVILYDQVKINVGTNPGYEELKYTGTLLFCNSHSVHQLSRNCCLVICFEKLKFLNDKQTNDQLVMVAIKKKNVQCFEN